METNLREQILSEENIYKAIFALESYISERNLLNAEDLETFYLLRDKYNFKFITKIIEECKLSLTKLLDNEEEVIEINVYFKIKKLNTDNESKPIVEYRPLHTANLLDQICMASMLMPLMFDDSNGKRNLSELSRMIPHNFYGNIPNCNVDSIFMNWRDQYRQYSQIVTEHCREYSKTHKYDKEISFDLKDFFPSINPQIILNYIWNTLSNKYKNEDDKKSLKIILSKLLYFKIPEINLHGWKDVYYKEQKDSIKAINGFYPSRGIAQGLPQSYFFGNLCMIEIAKIMNKVEELKDSDSYYYVDDSVVFAKNINNSLFTELIKELNHKIELDNKNHTEEIYSSNFILNAKQINYKIEFHQEGKSTICDIKDSFKGMDGLFEVQRPISMGGWIKGNIDEVDDNVALKKLDILQQVVKNEIDKIQSKRKENSTYGEERLKWLRRYKKYFLFRKKRLQILLNGKYEKKLKDDFIRKFKIIEVIRKKYSIDTINKIFEAFDEEIFKSEFELLLMDMPQKEKNKFCNQIMRYDTKLSNVNCDIKRETKFLYYYHISNILSNIHISSINEYESLNHIVRNIHPFNNSKTFINAIKSIPYTTGKVWKLLPFLNNITKDSNNKKNNSNKKSVINQKIVFPSWCSFIFWNSDNFKRKILNACFSYTCNIQLGDNLSIVRSDIKPIKYYELRIISMLRNYGLKIIDFFEFVNSLDITDINEKVEIDLSILEALGIFRQRIHEPKKIDQLIQTHRLVKSLWHNGSKFLNAYTLHNHEHAINLIKNIVRLVNNIDFLNLKANDFFLLFNACYLHDISMVIHPDIAHFNDSNIKSEQLITKWFYQIQTFNEKINDVYNSSKLDTNKLYNIRKNIGLSLIEVFKDIFDFFENKVRNNHAVESASYIRSWQKNILSFLSELEADTIAKISYSHGWNSTDVYEIKSFAKEELVSIKYMMILIRLADLLDLANDRIDDFILKQNYPQMNIISRYHWISHLITDGCHVDVDYEIANENSLTDQPIIERIHIDIFLNTEIISNLETNKEICNGFCATLKEYEINKYPVDNKTYPCIEYTITKNNQSCNSNMCNIINNNRSCPFLCLWMSNKHRWLLTELGKLENYLNSVNSKLIKSVITVRFFYSNNCKLESKFYDDVKVYLTK